MFLPRLLLVAGLAGPAAAWAQGIWHLEKCQDARFMGLELAIDYCTRAIKSGDLSNRSLGTAYYNRGRLYAFQGRVALALADINETVRLDALGPEPDDLRAATFYLRGTLHAALRDHDRALADFDQSIRLYPRSAAPYLARGNAWLAKRDADRALADFNQALKADVSDKTSVEAGAGSAYARRPRNFDRTTNDSAAHLGRAIAFLQKADAESALGALGEGIRINPGNPRLFATRASLRARSRDYDGAIADYTAALRLNPKDVSGYHSRACVWAAKGEFANAVLDMDAALELDGRSETVRANRALIKAGEPCKD